MQQEREDLKGATEIDTSKFVQKVDLASLKSINKLGTGKLKTTPIDLSKLGKT